MGIPAPDRLGNAQGRGKRSLRSTLATAPWCSIAWACVAHIVSMTGFSTYPALLPRLQSEWGLSNTEAGLVSGLFFAGYTAAVPVLTALTDRDDARKIYVGSSLVAAFGSLGFGWLARGAASGGFFQLLVGVGAAGTYMPGLRVLTDNTDGFTRSRAVSYYTAFFGPGVSLSLILASQTARHAGWRAAFLVAAIGPVLAAAMFLTGFPARRPRPSVTRMGLLDVRGVLANRAVTPYVWGYAVHCWELFGARSWMVAFLTFAQGLTPAPISPSSMYAVANLTSPLASVAGNEVALRVGRRSVVVVTMTASGIMTCALGFAARWPWELLFAALLVHMLLVMSDSSTLTAGMVAASEIERRGATMAVHSTVGFGAGFVAPFVFGLTLDLAGGNRTPLAWGIAFGTLGIGGVVAATRLPFEPHPRNAEPHPRY